MAVLQDMRKVAWEMRRDDIKPLLTVHGLNP